MLSSAKFRLDLLGIIADPFSLSNSFNTGKLLM